MTQLIKDFVLPGKVNMVVDATFGSCGKGLIAAKIALDNKIDVAIASLSPNAGHTAHIPHWKPGWESPVTVVSKLIPVAAIIQRDAKIFITSDSVLDPDTFFKEMQSYEIDPARIIMHPRAAVITPEVKEMENLGSSVAKIASTQSGTGAARSTKIMRSNPLAQGYEPFHKFIDNRADFWINEQLDGGSRVFLESGQGLGLGLNHGFQYPNCLSGESRIRMADGRYKMIKDIVVGDMVVALDHNTKKTVIKPVINTWMKDTGDRKFHKIITETSSHNQGNFYGGKYTNEHRVKTVSGVKTVDQLRPGDMIFNDEYELSGDGLQIFLGSMLGDGTVCKMKKSPARARVEISHSAAQKAYAEAKGLILQQYVGGGCRDFETNASSFKEDEIHTRYESKFTRHIRVLAEELGCYGTKTPNVEKIVELMDNRALAIWYQDDGNHKIHRTYTYKNGKKTSRCHESDYVRMFTNGFAYDEVERLSVALKEKFGLTFHVNTHKANGKNYPILILSIRDIGRFFNMIKGYIHPCMAYKLPDTECRWGFGNDIDPCISTEKIIEIQEFDWKASPRRVYSKCYDIEVADVHNFYVNNGMGGNINVENCTSRDILPSCLLGDVGVHPDFCGNVMATLRTYPIRVGNIVQDGETIGNSGSFYPDSKELTWDDMKQIPELTTVTKRVRRIATFSYQQWQDALKLIRPSHVFLNFVNYLHGDDHEIFDRLMCDFPNERFFIGTGPMCEDISLIYPGVFKEWCEKNDDANANKSGDVVSPE